MSFTPHDHFRSVGKPAERLVCKKKRPKLIAVVDEDNCTGCQVCVPFCPTDCIAPVPETKYTIPIPPVQVRFHECIGCQLCYHACNMLSWRAIHLLETAAFEQAFGVTIGASVAESSAL